MYSNAKSKEMNLMTRAQFHEAVLQKILLSK